MHDLELTILIYLHGVFQEGFFKWCKCCWQQEAEYPNAKKFSNVSRKNGAPASQPGRKRASNSSTKFSASTKIRRKEIVDEEISSEDDVDESDNNDNGSRKSEGEYEDESIAESTAGDKQLLKTIKTVARDGESDTSDDDSMGLIEKPAPVTVHRKIAQNTKFVSDQHKDGTERLLSYRPHRLSPVCVSFSSDGKYVVSCSKDGSISKYDLENRRICKVLKLSKTLDFIQEFKAHRSEITSLVFRKTLAPIELFSGSADRSVKAWNLDQMGFVDTMYGHQDVIQQMDMLSRARVLTCVFNGFADAISIDAVALINEDHFVSGSADGSIYLWSVFKKKPVCVVKRAHGVTKRSEKSVEPNWICSVASCPYTDLVASGSSDGVVRLWKVGEDYKSMKVVDEFTLTGFVNSIRFTEDAKKLACAVGQEHRNGRWWKIQEARNSIVVIPLAS
uniref:Uncharacterized protein n=1 Tax=Ditylenchus dipsaci TaxID=166011 RepID=A0A915D034_9BILA